MAKVNGRIYSCDRCGNKIFVKAISEKETDGGFTRYNTFEDMPDGWGYDCRAGMDLCPKCKKELDSIIALYKDGNKNPLKTFTLKECSKGDVVVPEEEYWSLKQAKTLLELREETIKHLEDANIRYYQTLTDVFNNWLETDKETGGFNLPHIYEFAKSLEIEIKE